MTRAGWTGRLPGGLVSAWYSPGAVSSSPKRQNASGRRRRLRPSPETATSGQSPHESNGYSTLDHLLSRVLRIVRREQAVFGQLDVKSLPSPSELQRHGQHALAGGYGPPDEAVGGRHSADPARRSRMPERARQRVHRRERTVGDRGLMSGHVPFPRTPRP